MKYVRLSGRILLNAASLNTQGAGGTNYIELTKIPIVVKEADRYALREVPAISGNMVKRYHFVGFVDFLKREGYGEGLTEDGARYVAYRFAERTRSAKSAAGVEVALEDESKIIRAFADADLHGFLAPQTQVRRESLCKFSFLLPVEEAVLEGGYGVEAVTHNRVVISREGKIVGREEEARAGAMMIFKRQYASAPFGFSVVLDLTMIGVPQADPTKGPQIEEKERKARSKAAILGLLNLLTGQTGAGTSRAFPAEEVEELIAVASPHPIPPLVHGFYKDYAEQSAKNLAHYVKMTKLGDFRVFVYARDGSRKKELVDLFTKELGDESSPEDVRDRIQEADSPVELISLLASYVTGE